ncbi:MAG: DUF3291 domain-containing protein [Streptosporangiales bacterium]|nr:DUF3291 domain-containing protein [Streptosporangiales bacterium]
MLDTRHPGHHLAQFNVGLLRAPLESPELADFVALLDPINALAEESPGFVWRLQTEEGDATSVRPYGDMVIVNLSVWESGRALWDFAYASRHLDVVRRRREWFERMAEPYLVLWWVGAGHVPTVAEAMHRLDLLRHEGPSPSAFTFRRFLPPSCGAFTGRASGGSARGSPRPAGTYPATGHRARPR